MNLEKLKTNIIITHTFFGSLLHKMDHVVSSAVPTACTDGKVIIYNEKFMDTLPEGVQETVVCHELLHGAFLHAERFKSLALSPKDAECWNRAADYLINDLLQNQMGMKLGSNWLIDSQYKFDDWTTEELFRHLKKNKKGSGGSGGKAGSAVGAGHDMMPGEQLTPEQLKKLEVDWNIAINAAAQIAKQAGRLPSSLQRLVDRLVKPKIDWKKELFDWLSAKVNVETTWNKGNRRFLGRGIYLPARQSEGIGELVVAIDTSGSVGSNELAIFASELNHSVALVKPSKVTVVYCDAAINKVTEFGPDDFPVTLEPVGGGGTDFCPVFNWISNNREAHDIAGLIYMTDMYGSFPKDEPAYPVAWMATSKVQPPFGKYIEFPFGEN